MITQFGLFLVIFFISSFTPKRAYDSWKKENFSSETSRYVTMLITLGVQVILTWLLAGYLLPYVHKYIPL